MDALQGLIRAPWFARPNLQGNQDLLIWTRALAQKKFLSANQMLQIKHIGLNRDMKKLERMLSDSERILRTIICQHDGSTRSFIVELQRQISPFAIVVDATPYGYREELLSLVAVMKEQFPGVPLLITTCIGDDQIYYSLIEINRKFQIPIWQSGQCEDVIWGKKYKAKWNGELALLPDHRLSERLHRATEQVRALHKALPDTHHEVASYPLFRVLSGLLTLCIPFSFHEVQSDISRRGGLFPSKPLSDWLAYAKRAKLPTGKSQSLLMEACEVLTELLEFVKDGKTGKQQALEKWIHDLLDKKETGRIVFKSERDSNLVRKWLISEYPTHSQSGSIDAISVGGSRGIYKSNGNWDRLLIIGKLTRSDTWVAGRGKRISWLSYPCEFDWLEKLSSSASLTASFRDSGKAEWWEYKNQDLEPHSGTPFAVNAESWSDCSGQYNEHRKVIIEYNPDENWLEELFQELDWKEQSSTSSVLGSKGIEKVLVRTDYDVYSFSFDTRVDVLTEEHGVSHIDVQDLQVDDCILMLHGEDREDFSPLEMLLENIPSEASKVEFYRQAASRWLDFLDIAVAKCNGVDGLKVRMSDTGVATSTLKSWVRRSHVVQKKRPQMIASLARISGVNPPKKDLEVIINALSKLQGMAIKAGKALKKASIARAEGADHIEAFGQVIPLDVIDDILNLETVISVSKNQNTEFEVQEPKSLYEGALDAIEKTNGRLVITKRGEKSLKESVFVDKTKVLKCLEIMGGSLFRVYDSGESLQVAIDELAGLGVDFKGATSSVTQGKFSEYHRTYNGKSVDIGKHLGIGDSRSPERCFRIHFHWEDQEKALVIHHAGKHLPTSNG
jgi:hypothetical protein